MNVCRQKSLSSLMKLSNARLQVLARYKSDSTQTDKPLTTDFSNPKWLQRQLWLFNFIDFEKTGTVSYRKVGQANWRMITHPDVAEGKGASDLTVYHETFHDIFKGVGCDQKSKAELTFEEYIRNMETFATTELWKWNNNETTRVQQWSESLCHALFPADVPLDVDTIKNKFTSTVFRNTQGLALESSTETDEVIGSDETTGVDVDRSGIDEFTRQHLGFWFATDSEFDDLYGHAVP